MRILGVVFPYGMQRNTDGTWTFFNRQYQPLGFISDEHADLDGDGYKLKIDGLTDEVIRQLSYNGSFDGHMIHFYINSISPNRSKKYLDRYLEKISILMSLEMVRS